MCEHSHPARARRRRRPASLRAARTGQAHRPCLIPEALATGSSRGREPTENAFASGRRVVKSRGRARGQSYRQPHQVSKARNLWLEANASKGSRQTSSVTLGKRVALMAGPGGALPVARLSDACIWGQRATVRRARRRGCFRTGTDKKNLTV